MSRSHHSNSKRASAWGTRFASLLAVFLQVFVIQTHVHAQTPAPPAGYEQAAHTSVSTLDQTTHGQISCAFCQAQHANSALPPSADAIAELEASQTIEAALAIRRVSVLRAYSWQSRAPPAVL